MTLRTSRFVAIFAAVVAALTFAIPLYVIRPFVPQNPHALAFALTTRNLAPWLSGLCAIGTVYLKLRLWKSARTLTRLTLLACAVIATSASALTRVNIFQQMFHPYPTPVFASAASAPIDPDDKLLSITIDSQTHAYPIRTMGYHHIVNDTLAGTPIAATYCTLCHTGIIYDRRLNGQTLYFTLAGINNGNALLRDRETGSIWQQSTGEAIFGPLKGQRLTLIPSDELTFALWKSERPNGLILRSNPQYAAEYDPKNWEDHIATTHVVVDVSSTGIEPHTIMLGIAHGADTKAFPYQQVLAAHIVQDRLPGYPLLLVVGPDNASVRVFSPRLPNEYRTLSFLPNPDGTLTDRQTSSTWSFTGCATAGPLQGKCLTQIEAHKDYWFDWHNHHPETLVFRG